jgi:hypothetical protein
LGEEINGYRKPINSHVPDLKTVEVCSILEKYYLI